MVLAGMTGFQGCFYNWRENMLAGIPDCSSLKDPLTWLAQVLLSFCIKQKVI